MLCCGKHSVVENMSCRLVLLFITHTFSDFFFCPQSRGDAGDCLYVVGYVVLSGVCVCVCVRVCLCARARVCVCACGRV